MRVLSAESSKHAQNGNDNKKGVEDEKTDAKQSADVQRRDGGSDDLRHNEGRRPTVLVVAVPPTRAILVRVLAIVILEAPGSCQILHLLSDIVAEYLFIMPHFNRNAG